MNPSWALAKSGGNVNPFYSFRVLLSNFRSSETHKGAIRADRKIKELQFTREEEQKNFERLNELVEKLQHKTRTYKKQIEDAEEIAALNLAKFRKAQQQLEEVMIELVDYSEN